MSEILANAEQYPGENRCLPQTQDKQSDIKPNFLKGEILEHYLANKAEYFASMGLLRWYNGEWFMFNNIVYQPLIEDFFNNFAYKTAMRDNIILKPKHCKELLESIKIRICETFTDPDDESFTVFKNGLISNFNGMPLSVIPSDYFATIYVDAQYLSDVKLEHPLADAFLNTISGGDSELITRHWEFWGYVLSSDYHAKAIFSLVGESGNNGKSTELDMLKMFLPGAVDNMPIKTMTSTFGMQRIRHCRLEYSADEGAVNLGSESIAFLKSASGFDDITANVKFRKMVHFKCKCKIAIASNYNIGMAYAAVDTAFMNRIVTIPYPYSIP